MRKIELYGKSCRFAVSNLLDGYKISEIEFELGINDCDNVEDIDNYLIKLTKERKITDTYKGYETHKDSWLFYFVDGLGNKSYLNISKT